MSKSKKIHKKAVVPLLAIAILLIILLLCTICFIKGKLDLIQYDDGKSTGDIHFSAEKEDDLDLDLSGIESMAPQQVLDGEIFTDESVINILLLGTDDRGENFSDNARSDAMLLLSINRENKTAKLVSLERGMGVPILEGVYEGQYDWLTHCFRYGGADLVMKEVRECFKVDVEHFVRVNFYAVIRIVDLLGGIDVNLTQEEADYLNAGHNPYEIAGGETRQAVSAGQNHLNGVTALAYARIRKIDSDWQRVKRQQTVIQACVDQLKNASISTLNDLLDQVLPMVQTNFTQWEIARLMLLVPDFLGVQFERMTLPVSGTYGSMRGMGGRSMFAPDFSQNAALLQDFLYGKDSA